MSENLVLRKTVNQYCPRRINQCVKRKNVEIAKRNEVIKEQLHAQERLRDSQLARKNRQPQNEVRKLKRQNKKYRKMDGNQSMSN